MTLTGGKDEVITRLAELKDRPGLAKGIRKQCADMHDRLTRPIRVLLAGPPHSGKSELLNMLVSHPVIPPGASYPTMELSWGDKPRTIVTYVDGSTSELPGLVLRKFPPEDLAFVKLEAPLPRLELISLLEIVTDGSAEEQAQALNWAIPRTDMALWCAQDFPKRDRQIWSQVPDELKDHSYFILTKADLIAAAGVVSEHIRKLQAPVGDEFRGMFPVAARQAIEAREAGDENALRASGAPRLIAELLRDVERGRQAIADAALMFLARSDPDRKSGVARKTRPEKAPAIPEPAMQSEALAETAAAEPPEALEAVEELAPVAEPEPVAELEPFEEFEPLDELEPFEDDYFEDDIEEMPAAGDEGISSNDRVLCAEGFEYLRRRARDLSRVIGDEPADSADVLGHCMETIEHLVDVFADADIDSAPIRLVQDTVNEASDIVMLLQLEEDIGPAADAVTLLLQLRRDFEAKIAA